MDYTFFLALIAAMGYGVTTIIYKIASQHIDPLSQSLVVSLFTTVVLFVLWLLIRISGYHIIVTKYGITMAALGGVLAGISLLSYVTSVTHGNPSVSSTLRNLSFLVTVILSLMFLAEKFSLAKAAGIVAALLSILLLSL